MRDTHEDLLSGGGNICAGVSGNSGVIATLFGGDSAGSPSVEYGGCATGFGEGDDGLIVGGHGGCTADFGECNVSLVAATPPVAPVVGLTTLAEVVATAAAALAAWRLTSGR